MFFDGSVRSTRRIIRSGRAARMLSSSAATSSLCATSSKWAGSTEIG